MTTSRKVEIQKIDKATTLVTTKFEEQQDERRIIFRQASNDNIDIFRRYINNFNMARLLQNMARGNGKKMDSHYIIALLTFKSFQDFLKAYNSDDIVEQLSQFVCWETYTRAETKQITQNGPNFDNQKMCNYVVFAYETVKWNNTTTTTREILFSCPLQESQIKMLNI